MGAAVGKSAANIAETLVGATLGTSTVNSVVENLGALAVELVGMLVTEPPGNSAVDREREPVVYGWRELAV